MASKKKKIPKRSAKWAALIWIASASGSATRKVVSKRRARAVVIFLRVSASRERHSKIKRVLNTLATGFSTFALLARSLTLRVTSSWLKAEWRHYSVTKLRNLGKSRSTKNQIWRSGNVPLLTVTAKSSDMTNWKRYSFKNTLHIVKFSFRE